MSVHYKFKSALEYDTITFDGLHISVKDLKNSIMQQKRIGKNTDFDLQVINAQTKEAYENDDTLIPKNTSLLIARIPSTQTKPKTWEGYGDNSSPLPRGDDGGPAGKATDLSSADATEDDKIRAMMSQSTQDYDPSNYMKIRGSNQIGAVPPNYRCFKCHQGGHWIKDCALTQGTESLEIKKSTGIPRSFMVPVDGPQVQGAMMTPNGSFAVPVLDHQAYTEKPQPAPPEEKRPDIPEDLVCSICSDLLTDAVMIPCCGNSFCDECIRSCLLESEEHECPDCHERDISPGTLIPNRFLRNAVSNFKNTTGYVKRPVYRLPSTPVVQKQTEFAPDEQLAIAKIELSEHNAGEGALDSIEKTIIREADSTEHPKHLTGLELTEDLDVKNAPKKIEPTLAEGPPGVSPHHEPASPKARPIASVASRGNSRSSHSHRSNGTNDKSPRRLATVKRSPSYHERVSRNEERPGTPTVDEPGIGVPSSLGPTSVYHTAPVQYSSGHRNMPTMIGLPPPNMQGPPPQGPGSYGGQPPPNSYPIVPPTQGPPPNFRLPPPGPAPAPFMSGPYAPPPRPMYDPSRPPLHGGPPPGYGHGYPPGGRPPRGRDFPPRDQSRRGRTPPRIIDDPLEAFNRMLREKDERERRAKQRKARSYSRSSSRSYSPSPRRLRSRSPRRRNSRSRSRSFSISRSRSRSFSPSARASPPPLREREFSPKGSPRRRAQSRYRSPIRSPPRFRYKDPPPERGRDMRDFGKDHDRDRGDREFRNNRDSNRGFSRERERDFRDRGPGMVEQRDRDYGYYDAGFDRDRGRPRAAWNSSGPRNNGPPSNDQYYRPPDPPVQTPYVPPNRYSAREAYPQHHIPTPVPPPGIIHQHQSQQMPPMRRYDDVAPPGTEPPIPGLENTPRYDDPYQPDRNRTEHTTEKVVIARRSKEKESEKRDDREKHREEQAPEKEHKYESRNRSPEKARHSSPPRTKEKERERQSSPHRRRRRDSSSDKEKHKRNASDDEKSKKAKEKKKKKEKKEAERKKRKEKREKREQEKAKKVAEEKECKLKEETKRKELEAQEAAQKTEEIENQEVVTESPPREIEPKVRKIRREIEIKIDTKQDLPKEEIVNNAESDLYGDLLSDGIDNQLLETYGKLEDCKAEANTPTPKAVTPEPQLMEEGEIESDINDSKDQIHEEEFEEAAHFRDDEDSEKDVLDLHTNEAELKADLEGKPDFLAPVPEKSKWEVDDDVTLVPTTPDYKGEKLDKTGKVTNEVLKRAENAIFAKAINAIRPIEIKKISLDRAKLYSGDRERDRKVEESNDSEVRNLQVTISGGSYEDDIHPPGTEPVSVKPRLSVKERLGCKVDDLDRIVKIDRPYDRNRSRSLSPLSKRAGELNRNLTAGERRIEVDERRRMRREPGSRHRGGDNREQHNRSFRNPPDPRRDHRGIRRDDLRRDLKRGRERDHRREEHKPRDSRDGRRRSPIRVVRPSTKPAEGERDKRRRSKSESRERKTDKDKRKKKDKREKKKEKTKKHHKKDDDEKETDGSKADKHKESEPHKPKSATDRRKPTLDEANFEPDYDLESESDKDEEGRVKEDQPKKRSRSKSPQTCTPKKKIKIEEKKESSSSYSTDSSSEEDKKKKKHRKHKKKKRKETSSSSSESESDSSDDEKDKKKRKHRKKQKKRKKSKHK